MADWKTRSLEHLWYCCAQMKDYEGFPPLHVTRATGPYIVLADGTRVEADYVNLGTLIVRGMTPAGRVDIPWRNIQTVEFRR
jgi:hypothetical protein